MLEKILTDLGLGIKEQSLYKIILEKGKVPATTLSRLAKINRTTVYSVAKELLQKGLIVEDLGGKTTYYSPAPVSELDRLIIKEKERIAQKEHTIKDLKEVVQSFPSSTAYSVPKIRFIEEGDLEHYLHEATPRWIESQRATQELTWWGFQDHTFAEKYEKWIDWFWKKAPQEIDLKLFSNDSDIEVQMKEKDISRRMIRFWSGESNFTSTQWVVGEYVVSVLTKEKPYYLVEIHDAVLAHNMREVFKELWKK
ncbi:MAG: helix-turn-helix domain-containing protein [bacterium]